MEVKNTDYNFIRTRMKRLEETYKQSSDPNVRNIVKEKTYFELAERISGFEDEFGELFEKCKMSSLMEICQLSDYVIGCYSPMSLPEVTSKQAKRMLKLKERDLNIFLREYNNALKGNPLTYYSQQIDQKVVFVTEDQGQLVGVVGSISPNQRNRETLCPFCRKFRKGDEIRFVSIPVIGKKGEYSSIGQYCCSDMVKCNADIEETEALTEFVGYSYKKK